MNHQSPSRYVSPILFIVSSMVAAMAAAQTPPLTLKPMDMPSGGMQKNMQGMKGTRDEKGSEEMHQSMMSGMEAMKKAPMTGDADRDFAMMMKMHHQQGVEMAQAQLKNGKSPEMNLMAKQIIAAQNKEIEQFDKWLAKQK